MKNTFLIVVALALLAGIGALTFMVLAPAPPAIVPIEPALPALPARDPVAPSVTPPGSLIEEPLHGAIVVRVATDVSDHGVSGAMAVVHGPLEPDEEVTPDREAEFEVVTDSQGEARIDAIGAGRVVVLVLVPGRAVPGGKIVAEARVRPGTVNQIALAIPEGGVLRGIVRDPSGKPLAGAIVRVAPANLVLDLHPAQIPGEHQETATSMSAPATSAVAAERLRRLLRIASVRSRRGELKGMVTRSDENGFYQLAGLPASLPARLRGPDDIASTAIIAMHADFAPVIARVALAIDEPVTRDVFFTRDTFAIRGVVRHRDQPAPDVPVYVLIEIAGGELIHHPLISDEFGAFGLPSVLDPSSIAQVTLVALHPDQGWAIASIARPGEGPLVLELLESSCATIRFRDPENRPLAGASLRLAINFSGIDIPMNIYSNLGTEIRLPVLEGRFAFTGGAQPPTGYRCIQSDPSLFIAAYDLDAEILFAEEPTFIFEPGAAR